jgi:hypothetical protein
LPNHPIGGGWPPLGPWGWFSHIWGWPNHPHGLRGWLGHPVNSMKKKIEGWPNHLIEGGWQPLGPWGWFDHPQIGLRGWLGHPVNSMKKKKKIEGWFGNPSSFFLLFFIFFIFIIYLILKLKF